MPESKPDKPVAINQATINTTHVLGYPGPTPPKQLRRVLIIAYYWPPAGGSGVQRWLKMVKYLRHFGFEPVVYTVSNADYPVSDATLLAEIPVGIEVIKRPIWEPYKLYKIFTGKGKDAKLSINLTTFSKAPGITEKLSLWFRGNLFVPDAKAFWVRPSVNFLLQYLRENPVEAIISTSPPQSMQLIARNIKRKLGLPWVADFRDPWTDIDFYQDLKLTSIVDAIQHRMERSVLTEADAVVSVGKTMGAMLRKKVERHIDIIPNGYDASDLQAGTTLTTKFSLLHIGVLLKNRNHPFLWRVLGQLVADNPNFKDDLQLHLVGQLDYNVENQLLENGLIANTIIAQHVPHQEAVKMQQQSRVLMLFIDNIPTAKHTLTGKFFEYLMTGRPILCIGPEDGDAATIIAETNAGYTVNFDAEAQLKTTILAMYARYKAGEDTTQTGNISPYSRYNLAGKMADVLNRITNKTT